MLPPVLAQDFDKKYAAPLLMPACLIYPIGFIAHGASGHFL
jgi:hypothetical protein